VREGRPRVWMSRRRVYAVQIRGLAVRLSLEGPRRGAWRSGSGSDGIRRPLGRDRRGRPRGPCPWGGGSLSCRAKLGSVAVNSKGEVPECRFASVGDPACLRATIYRQGIGLAPHRGRPRVRGGGGRGGVQVRFVIGTRRGLKRRRPYRVTSIPPQLGRPLVSRAARFFSCGTSRRMLPKRRRPWRSSRTLEIPLTARRPPVHIRRFARPRGAREPGGSEFSRRVTGERLYAKRAI